MRYEGMELGGAQDRALASPAAIGRVSTRPFNYRGSQKTIAESKSSPMEIESVDNNHSTTLTVIMLVVPA